MRAPAAAWLCSVLVAGLALSGCGAGVETAALPTVKPSEPSPVVETVAAELTLTSTAFAPGDDIPEQYTCFGDNLSPELAWSGVPSGAQSLALIVLDPDSRPPGFVHWVIYSISPAATGLTEGVLPQATLADGARQGRTDFAQFGAGTFPGGRPINQVGYDGPCPPDRHRYVFTLYALDSALAPEPEATATELVSAMQGHILAQVELVGLYSPPE